MGWCQSGDELGQEIFDAVGEFISQLMRRGEQLADRFDVPMYCIKAMHRIGAGVTMKDLGQSLHCDPSFVTTIADMLEQRGLARREPSPADRRVKNLVLTDQGLQVKAMLERHILGAAPWTYALDPAERRQFLSLIRKMSEAIAAEPPVPADPGYPDLSQPSEAARS